jgi:hypothetical protein
MKGPILSLRGDPASPGRRSNLVFFVRNLTGHFLTGFTGFSGFIFIPNPVNPVNPVHF